MTDESASTQLDQSTEPWRRTLCRGCTLLCDDVEWLPNGETIADLKNFCGRGRSWIDQMSQSLSSKPIGELNSTPEVAADALTVLNEAKSPLIVGLNWLSVNEQQLAIRLARKLRASIDIDLEDCAVDDGTTSAGTTTATLGEFARLVETIVFWNVDPIDTHPRLLDRLHSDRKKIWMVHDSSIPAEETSSRMNVKHIALDRSQADRLFSCLRTRTTNSAEDLAALAMKDVAVEGMLPHENLGEFIEELLSSRHIGIFHPPGDSRQADSWAISLRAWARQKYATGRCYLLPLRMDQNALGAENALTATTGFARAVNFATGFARSNRTEFSARRLLNQGVVDVVLFFWQGSQEVLESHTSELGQRNPNTKWIIVTPASRAKVENSILIPCSPSGLATAGDWTRLDGVMLPSLRTFFSERLSVGALLANWVGE